MKKAINYLDLALSSPRIDARIFSVVLLSLLTALSAQVEIPLRPVPVTFQTFTVLLGAAFLGRYRASASQFLYILLGIAGLPVFAGFSFGIAKLIGPTGGYISGFVAASYVTAYMLEKGKSFVRIFISMLCGSLIIFIFGVIQLYAAYTLDWSKAIQVGFLNFALWDFLKVLAASFIFYAFLKNKS